MDPFLMVVAPAGIAFLVFLSWALGGWGRAAIPDAAAAAARLALDEPDFEPRETLIAADGRAALLLGADGHIAAVMAAGDKQSTRVFAPGEVASASVTEDGRAGKPVLKIVTGDWTWGTLTIALDPEARAAGARFAALLQPRAADKVAPAS